ncbi:LysR family transcriptional regulator [Aliivibrio fischeri]|uniref:LysR family transcriptional regulator n=1 Tax=Aliivibrio fischeri TaxID=668 RepID=UPI00105CC2CB|nr:LysR family transcriptional regulator [Aliivibrio fischeri]MUK42410.1 LysR family transcriptional regulator [Aliivibrio fischeri]TDM54428.1 LysR family transcriptional regulator [Aliivibrio fischeri]
MLNLKQLETFVWIAHLGSFRQAAKHLCTTQPAISTRIANLEETLNTALFYRDTGSISLTAKGRELLPLAEKLLSNADQLQVLANSAEAISGILRIGVSETVVHTWLPHYLALIHQNLPHLEVELIVDATINLRKELLARNIDIAILLGVVDEPNVVSQAICNYDLHWVASPALQQTQKNKVLNFAQWPLITYARNTSPYYEIERYFNTHNNQATRFYSASSLSASIRLAESGIGIAILPKEVIHSSLQNNTLEIIEADWSPSPLQFSVAYIDTPVNLMTMESVKLTFEAVKQYKNVN